MRRARFAASCVLLALILSTALSHSALAQSEDEHHLWLHDLSVQIVEDVPAYDLTLRFSLLDSGGNPVKDATEDSFSLTEDGEEVQIASLDMTSDEPINVTFLLDTSGSMLGNNMAAARKAAVHFVSRLREDDRVAIVTFNETTVRRIDLTRDHTAAQQEIELIQATSGTGTCLYDATYETLQWATKVDPGRQALVLLTDGVDELSNGRPCSRHTVDDVIEIASRGAVRIPIYTIGLGRKVDAETLGQIASASGGRYLYAPDETQLEALFGRLSDELRFQYDLRYTSTAEPGNHTLRLTVRHRGIQDEVSRHVELPAYPYILMFLSPEDGAEIRGETELAVDVMGQGAPIARVQFLANGKSLGIDETAPYELLWTPSELEPGSIFLEAIAQSAQGTELARTGVNVVYQAPHPATGTPETTARSSAPSGPSTADQPIGLETIPVLGAGKLGDLLSTTTLALLGGALLILTAIILAVVAARRRSREREDDERWRRVVQGEGSTDFQGSATDKGGDEHTIDSFAPSDEALAVLVVLQSDDAAMIGQRFEITNSVTRLGRKADNDIIFPNDNPVSRRHAIIEERGGNLFLSEFIRADESGVAKRPTFGTFVNGRQIKDPVLLRDGDVIQLGKRVRLRFEALRPSSGNDDERTVDQLAAGDDDENTMDSEIA